MLCTSYWVRNYKGILMWQNQEILEFEIVNRDLIVGNLLTKINLPWPISREGLNYVTLNEHFKRRVVLNYSQDIDSYLKAMGLEYYDFEELVKRNNGLNHLDCYWVKEDGKWAQSWSEILNQQYPIYSKKV